MRINFFRKLPGNVRSPISSMMNGTCLPRPIPSERPPKWTVFLQTRCDDLAEEENI